MEQGDLTWFSVAEFLVLLTLDDPGPCLILTPEEEPDDDQLRRAAVSLSQRGLIEPQGDSFVLTETGRAFSAVKSADRSAVLTGSTGRKVVLYRTGSVCTVLELVSTVFHDSGFRLQKLDASGLQEWLLDSGILPDPVLKEQDMEEWNTISPPEPESSKCPALFQAEAYQGCSPAGSWSVIQEGTFPVLIRSDGRPAQFYTTEARQRLIAEILGLEAV